MMKLRLGSTDLVVFQVIEEREPRSWEANCQGLTERWWSGEDEALPPASWAAALLIWPHPDSLAGHSLTAPRTYPRGICSKTLSGCPRPWIVLNPVHTAVSYTNGRVVYTGWRVGGQETSLCHLEWVHSLKFANYFQDFPFNAVGGELTVGNWNHGKWNQGGGGGGLLYTHRTCTWTQKRQVILNCRQQGPQSVLHVKGAASNTVFFWIWLLRVLVETWNLVPWLGMESRPLHEECRLHCWTTGKSLQYD